MKSEEGKVKSGGVEEWRSWKWKVEREEWKVEMEEGRRGRWRVGRGRPRAMLLC